MHNFLLREGRAENDDHNPLVIANLSAAAAPVNLRRCSHSRGNNDARARCFARRVIAMTQSRIKVHGFPRFEVERLRADREVQFPGD